MRTACFSVCLFVLSFAMTVHSQGSGAEAWELVRAFEEITLPVVEEGAGGFDFDEDGNILLFEAKKGLLYRYSADSGFATREIIETDVFPSGASKRARYRDGLIYFYGHRITHAVTIEDATEAFAHQISFVNAGNRGDGFGFPIVVGDLIIARNSRGYSSIQVQFDDPDREPEYRDAAATREMIEERGEELGVYFDEAGYLWARDEPHDWLVTSNPKTFNEVFGLPRRRGAFGDFAGRDKEGNYYWGGSGGVVVFDPGGSEIAVVSARIEASGSVTGARVNAEGVVYIFAYNGKPYNYERERLDLYRLDTGIITGR